MDTDNETRKPTERERVQKELMHTLAVLGGQLTSEDDVVFEGTKLVLPATMSIGQAIDTLKDKMRADEEETRFVRTYKYRPLDGARATRDALFKAFGLVTGKATWSFFGKNPPQLRDINVSATETEQVPWGALSISHLAGTTMHLSATHDPELGVLFQLMVEGPRKWRFHIEGIFKLIEDELRTNSMYRAKAFNGQEEPDFLDLRGVDPSKVIYSDEVLTQLNANVWSLLDHTEAMRELGVPLKRAVLLEGPYGTGKTLAAHLTAQHATDNGWTFIYCRPAKDNLEYVMTTAQLYQPAVVFFEDVDTVADGESDVTRLLDIFDGISAKGTQIICVLTTNHKERIHKGMVRPGRLDAVIHVGALDLSGIMRMVAATVPPEKVAPITDEEWAKIHEAMDGFMPAFVREAIDRAVRYNVARNQGELTQLQAIDFVEAAEGLRPQLELMEGASDTVAGSFIERGLSELMVRAIDGTVIDRGGEEFARLATSDDEG